MLTNLRQRIAVRDESGFTLIELLVVLIIIGVLLAIAVPSYLGFKDRAEQKASGANVRAAVPAVEAYYGDNNTYVGMTAPVLDTTYDAGLKLTGVSGQTIGSYCIWSTVGSFTSWKKGPAGDITTNAKNITTVCP